MPMRTIEDLTIDDSEAKAFGLTDRELIKHLFKKIVLLEERVNELEFTARVSEEWIQKNQHLVHKMREQQ